MRVKVCMLKKEIDLNNEINVSILNLLNKNSVLLLTTYVPFNFCIADIVSNNSACY